jgi:hypothetical protein
MGRKNSAEDLKAPGIARELLAAFDRAWTREQEYNLNGLKKFPTAGAILKAPGSVQASVAIRIVETLRNSRLAGKRKEKRTGLHITRSRDPGEIRGSDGDTINPAGKRAQWNSVAGERQVQRSF